MEELSNHDGETYYIQEVEVTSEKVVVILTQTSLDRIEKSNLLPLTIITLLHHNFTGSEATFKEKFEDEDGYLYDAVSYEISDNRIFRIFDQNGYEEIAIECAEIHVEKKPYSKKHLWKYIELYENEIESYKKVLKESEDENRDLQNTIDEVAEFLKKEIDSLDKKLEMLEDKNDSRVSHWKKEKENFLKVQRILNK